MMQQQIRTHPKNKERVFLQWTAVKFLTHNLPPDVPFVFDKGFTGDAGSFLSRSTGMGLYLVQKMAKDLAIDLQITSQLSCGTTIILMFPKVQYPVRRFDDATADSYANTKEK